MKKTLVLCAALLMFGARVCPAQDARPNFTGRWVLNAAKSELGSAAAAIIRIDAIEHKEPRLKQTITAKVETGEHITRMVYTTDGKENTNTVAPHREVKSTTRWEGSRLVIRSKAVLSGGTVESKEVWELSPDGKVLTVSREMRTPNSSANHKLVFNKQ